MSLAIPWMLALASAPSLPPESPAVFAVVVANNHASPKGEDLAPLRYADDDGARYLELFELVAEKVFLHTVLDSDSQRVFPEAARVSRPPTRRALERTLAETFEGLEAARSAGRRTELYFVFVGHGSVSSGGEGIMHLLDDGFSRSDLFQQVIAPSPADRNHVIVDACNAFLFVGGRGSAAERARVDAAVDQYLARERMAQHPNTGFVLSTSAAAEVHEWSGFRAGVFSHEVRSALLGGGDVDGDGEVSYRELQAFLQAANLQVEDPKARIRAWVAPPPSWERAPLFSRAWLTEVTASVRLGPSMAGRWSLDDERGVRVADVHLAEDGPVTLLLPGRRSHRLLQEDRQLELDPGASPARVVDATQLSPRPLEARARSAMAVTFRRDLFAIPFGRAFLNGYQAAWQPPVRLELEAPPAEADATLRHWSGGSLLVLGAASVAAGLIAGELAQQSADRYRTVTGRPLELQSLRDQARDRELAANLLVGGGLALLLGGGVVLAW